MRSRANLSWIASRRARRRLIPCLRRAPGRPSHCSKTSPGICIETDSPPQCASQRRKDNYEPDSRGPQDGTPPASCDLRLDELRKRCAKPGWKLDPDYAVFFNKQSFDLCAEQFRTLRSRLYRLRDGKPIRTLLITSTSKGEGKSFVSLNLAQAIAHQRERRALLIDA